ncbi:MAG: hypothetical protein ABIJ28_01775 [Patescibacteria group bacterium]
MKYKYSALIPADPSSRWIKRPIVQIEVFGKNNSRKFNALINSGADYSLFNIQIAELIGLDLSNAKPHSFIGIGGSQPIAAYLLDETEIKINDIDKKIKIPVGFINSDSVGLLLGQEGFFDQHRIKFEKDHDIFEIIPTKQ